MSTASEKFPVDECETMAEAYMKAAEAGVAINGSPSPGVLYWQGTRRFISTSISNDFLISLISPKKVLTPAQLKHFDIEHERNRPLNGPHKNNIREYLINVDTYIVPPILLNAQQPLKIFTVKSPARTRPCVFVLPRGEFLFVTDGQHRVEALREAIHERPELKEDAVSVTIVEEEDIDRCQQDFYDAAQVKKLSPSLLVEFDQRAPFNAVTRDLVRRVRVFQGRIQRVGTQVSKKSPMLFTNSMIKRTVCAIVSGDQSNVAATAQIMEANLPLWQQRIYEFFEEFTQANAAWQLVAERNLATGQTLDIPEQREEYLHFTGAGLLIMGTVGYQIFAKYPTSSGNLSSEQQVAIHRLGRDIDWHRSNPMWQRSVIAGEGTIQPHRGVLQIAVYDVKQEIGLALEEKDLRDLARLEEKKRRNDEKKAAKFQAMSAEALPA